MLRYFIYGQDGLLVPMTCQDTPDMRRFVEWVRQHDRYANPNEQTINHWWRNIRNTYRRWRY